MSQEPQPSAQPAPKKSRTLVLLVGAVALTAAVAGGVYWMYGRPAQTAEKVVEPELPPAVISMDPFVVNLADTGTPRFLRVTMGLIVHGEETAKELEEDAVTRMKLRSSVLELLSQQTAARLVSDAGKAELKKAVAQRAAASTEHLKVTDVLFTEFIVQ